MADWHPNSEKCITEVTARIKELIRQLASAFALQDQSTVVTDGHVNEAAKTLMRGERKKKNPLVAVLRGCLELIGAGAVGGALTIYLGNQPNAMLMIALFFCGLVMYIAAKILEHATDL